MKLFIVPVFALIALQFVFSEENIEVYKLCNHTPSKTLCCQLIVGGCCFTDTQNDFCLFNDSLGLYYTNSLTGCGFVWPQNYTSRFITFNSEHDYHFSYWRYNAQPQIGYYLYLTLSFPNETLPVEVEYGLLMNSYIESNTDVYQICEKHLGCCNLIMGSCCKITNDQLCLHTNVNNQMYYNGTNNYKSGFFWNVSENTYAAGQHGPYCYADYMEVNITLTLIQ